MAHKYVSEIVLNDPFDFFPTSKYYEPIKLRF